MRRTIKYSGDYHPKRKYKYNSKIHINSPRKEWFKPPKITVSNFNEPHITYSQVSRGGNSGYRKHISSPVLYSVGAYFTIRTMKFRGPLGIPRVRSFAPLSEKRPMFNQELQGDEIEQAVVDIAQQMNVPAEDMSDEQRNELLQELAQRIYPDGDSLWDDPDRAQNAVEAKREGFVNCIDSEWGRRWAEGLGDSSGSTDESEIGKVAARARGCAGKVESDILG